MTAAQHTAPAGATVDAHHESPAPRPSTPRDPHPTESQRARRSPDQLHAERVAWGKLWGGLISEATRRWKGEL